MPQSQVESPFKSGMYSNSNHNKITDRVKANKAMEKIVYKPDRRNKLYDQWLTQMFCLRLNTVNGMVPRACWPQGTQHLK